MCNNIQWYIIIVQKITYKPIIYSKISYMYQSSKAIFRAAQYKTRLLSKVLTCIQFWTSVTDIKVSVKNFTTKKSKWWFSQMPIRSNKKLSFIAWNVPFIMTKGIMNHELVPPGQERVGTGFKPAIYQYMNSICNNASQNKYFKRDKQFRGKKMLLFFLILVNIVIHSPTRLVWQ